MPAELRNISEIFCRPPSDFHFPALPSPPTGGGKVVAAAKTPIAPDSRFGFSKRKPENATENAMSFGKKAAL